MIKICQSQSLRAVSAVAFALIWGQVAITAYAGPTPLADEPLQAQISAKPNILYTIDDSTSMGMDFLPDYIIGNTASPSTNFCRDGNGLMTLGSASSACGDPGTASYFGASYSITGNVFGSYNNLSAGSYYNNPRLPMMASLFNRMYYNPLITYTPPVRPNGTSFPTMNAANTNNWLRVFRNNWWNYTVNPSSGAVVNADVANLQQKVPVVRWCNTDWWSAAPTTDECRYNGYAFAAGNDGVGATPSATADYNYPFYTGIGSDARNYVYRTKTLYCDKSKLITSTTSVWTCPAATCASSTTSCGPWTQNPPTPPGQCPCTGTECPTCTRSCTTTCTVWNPTPSCYWNTVNTYDLACNNTIIAKVANADDPTKGDICRHAKVTYTTAPTGPTRAGAIYPPGTSTASPDNRYPINCGTIADINVPRHYYKVGVEWCNANATTATLKWKGYGNGVTCSPIHDNTTYKWPRFFQYLGEYTGNKGQQDPAFARFDLDYTTQLPATFSHDYWDEDTASVQTVSRSWLEEMENYANWYAYYRTRMLAAKTITSLAFNNLNDKVRVGFHALNDQTSTAWATGFLNIADFDATQKSNFIDKAEKLPLGFGKQTPTLDAMTRIGEWFASGASAMPGATDPINLSCQRNFHMLFTDGATNQPAMPTPLAGDNDRTVPGLPSAGVTAYTAPLVTGATWPTPIYEGATITSTTLADVALKYWVTDLRTSGAYMTNNSTWSTNEGSSSGNVGWQRLNFAALSLGAEGTLAADNATIGTPLQTTPWPNPSPPNKPGTPQTAIDDLWHATVNGFGSFVNANDPAELAFGMNNMLASLASASGARAGNAAATPNLSGSAAGKFLYKTAFDSGWSGVLDKIEIDPVTAQPKVQPPTWRASTVLTTQLTPTVAIPTPWFDNRRIVTVNDDTAAISCGPCNVQPFLYTKLSAQQLATLGTTTQKQQDVIEYLRGNKEKEGTKLKNFRQRPGPLGDFVNAQAVIVGDPWDATLARPTSPFRDATDPGYSAFASGHAGRITHIYAAGNDGMVHAFDDTDGHERWAFMPSAVFRPWSQQGIVNLTFQIGGSPLFFHYFYADATPRVADVDLSGTAKTGDWHTILVGGLGKGGPMVYALDVTDPTTVIDEASAATKVKWQFTNDNLGLTYGRPLIIKTRAYGWVVVVASGYNNGPPLKPSGDGKGHLFFLDPNNGTILKEIVASAAGANNGSAASPSGLAHISGFVKDFHDQTVEQIYAGDLNGNVWRFDVHDSIAANWTVDWFAELRGPGNIPQPITTEPQIEVDFATAIDRWVMIGTGKLLDVPDLSDLSIQSVYALRDGTINAMLTAGLPIRRGTLSAVVDAAGLATKPTDGWFDDLAVGQRIVYDVQAELNIIAYVGTEPGTDPCITGQPGNLFVREFTTGKSLLIDPMTSTVAESVTLAEGGVGLEIVSLFKNRGGTPDEPVLPPTLKLVLTQTSDGKRKVMDINLPNLASGNRMSWRIIGE